MLSAQKQEMPNDIAPQSSLPTASGFGKVLNSIQGLQQRLDDFSVEEVSRAHAKAHDLIRQLVALQTELNAITKLKDVLAQTDAGIRAIPEYDFALVDADDLENHPQLRAIVQASKLIRMHRLLRAARASADSVCFDLQTLPSSNEVASPIAAPGFTSEIPSRSETLLMGSTDGEVRASVSAACPPDSIEKKLSPLSSSVATQNLQARTYEFAELKLEEARPSRRNEDSAPSEKPEADLTRNTPADQAPFDKRLLNDLIESYGEFTFSTTSVSNTGSRSRNLMIRDEVLPEPQISPPIDSATSTPSQSVGTELILRESASTEMAQAKSPSTSEGPLALPAPDEEINRLASENAIAKSNSRGEIDRQLKNIIKDYGEYDLYSHQKTTSSKTAVIAVVAALGLALGGWYFFKAPSSTEPTPVEIMMPAGAAVDAEPSSGAKLNLKQKK